MCNIVIAGGGSAGYITALLTQHYYPSSKITLIESSKRGILGAGEGTTPHFIELLNKIGIDVSDIVRHCDGTIKSGINFKNWNGDGRKYIHDFVNNDSELSDCLALGIDYDSVGFNDYLANIKKVPIYPVYNLNACNGNPIYSTGKCANYAMHFDARKLANYLNLIAVNRNITIVDDEIVDFNVNESGEITEVILENKSNIKCSFIFDCTGFARLIIGKFYNQKWISYRDKLPVDKAIPFFVDHDGDVDPVTDAVALKYGWMWKIPTKNRFGSGYVFDSDYITPDEAKDELESTLGHKVDVPRVIDFNPGTYHKAVYKNCMAVGLSQSFIEPLEATSIWVSYLNLRGALESDIVNNHRDSNYSDILNERYYRRNDTVLNFINFHYYAAERDDSLFWKNFRHKHKIEEVDRIFRFLDNNLKMNPEMINLYDDFFEYNRDFNVISWVKVYAGLRLNSGNNEYNATQKMALESILNNYDNYSRGFYSHKEFLEYLR